MKISFYVSLAASGLCLLLSILLFIYGGSNQALQTSIQKQQQEMQKQQDQINTGNTISNEVGPKLLQDMAQVSVKDEKMKLLLAKHGYTVNEAPASPAPASPAPAATPASSASPAPAHASSPAPAATPNPRH